MALNALASNDDNKSTTIGTATETLTIPDKTGRLDVIFRTNSGEFSKDGGKVLICGPCLAEFGLKMEDLVPGVELGKPGLTQGFIFAENAKTLTW